ncbi:MAG: nitroreductase family protein [Candidatus Eisenbacteria bacterium]
MIQTIPLAYQRPPAADQLERAEALYRNLDRRRTVRDFAPDPLPEGLLDRLVLAAGTAPSGANQQPWRFVAVTDPALKREIRAAAEVEEREFYEHRATPEWLAELAPLGTDWRKPFLEVAPVLVVIFQIDFARVPNGTRKHYYVRESVGLAAGLFIAAVHTAGLACLTHTPSPMGFLGRILGRPDNERPFLLLPVGYPATGARVPAIGRKRLDEILVRNRADVGGGQLDPRGASDDAGAGGPEDRSDERSDDGPA